MITFLEYSYNLEQIIHMLKTMVNEKPIDIVRWIIDSIPPDYVDKLPEGSRADMALILLKVFDSDYKYWNKLGKFVEPLWDQSISGPGKTLGKELLNRISAKIMDLTGSDFFMSYSGNMVKSSIFKYTKKHVRSFTHKSNYRWGNLDQVFNTIKSDYTSQFNNYRQLYNKAK